VRFPLNFDANLRPLQFVAHLAAAFSMTGQVLTVRRIIAVNCRTATRRGNNCRLAMDGRFDIPDSTSHSTRIPHWQNMA
ncbi:MAG TPA: hypothetical protein PLY87_23910, partial [Planctomycetaceae bacterium]|nr:hypothetical protein [Planctomycetaceae bacterium]